MQARKTSGLSIRKTRNCPQKLPSFPPLEFQLRFTDAANGFLPHSISRHLFFGPDLIWWLVPCNHGLNQAFFRNICAGLGIIHFSDPFSLFPLENAFLLTSLLVESVISRSQPPNASIAILSRINHLISRCKYIAVSTVFFLRRVSIVALDCFCSRHFTIYDTKHQTLRICHGSRTHQATWLWPPFEIPG